MIIYYGNFSGLKILLFHKSVIVCCINDMGLIKKYWMLIIVIFLICSMSLFAYYHYSLLSSETEGDTKEDVNYLDSYLEKNKVLQKELGKCVW